jgi:hypothetical protein
MERYGVIDKLTSFVPQTHKLLDRLPEPWRSKAIIFGYKLGLIPSFGYIKMEGYTDDTFTKKTGQESITCNLITNQGATALRNIIEAALSGAGTDNQAYMDFGIGTTTPGVLDTDIETQPAGGAHPRLICTVTPQGSYEIRCEAFIGSGWGSARPILISEMALFTAITGVDNIAHALVSPAHNLTGVNTAKGTYGLLVR